MKINLSCKYIAGIPNNLKDRAEKVRKLAAKHHWSEIDLQENIGMISFLRPDSRGKQRINIYLTTMSTTTYLKHPMKGKGQLYRKNLSLDLLEKIFIDPRTHTGKGYYKKPNK